MHKVALRRMHVYDLNLIEFQSPLSFYVYDWDGSNVIDDDFLGSAHFCFQEVRNLHNISM